MLIDKVLEGQPVMFVVNLKVSMMKKLDYKLDMKLVPGMEEVLVKLLKVKLM